MILEAVRTSETSVDNYFTRQYILEDNSEFEILLWSIKVNMNIVLIVRSKKRASLIVVCTVYYYPNTFVDTWVIKFVLLW
jgi:hypothetical protein